MKVKVNNLEYEVSSRKTILEFLNEIGIYVPYLCYHPKLRPVGSCRLCIIQDRGRYRNSCATYLEDGMDIKTDTPELKEIRKWILQFLFGERNHYCMYCPVTNDCEFQRLGYYTGLDHFHFFTFKNIFDLDNTHEYILFDNNRCVLCGRCVRVCSEVAGHFVLSEVNKGINSLIVADQGVPLGESSCISCGLCVQVCPTGTFVDKYSMYLGRTWETDKYPSYCFECPVGCGIEIYSRKGNIVKIYSNWDSFTKGLICYKGRYQSLVEYRELQKKKIYPEVNILQNIPTTKSDNSIAIIDGTLFNEEIEIIANLFPIIYSLYEINPRILKNEITFQEIENYQIYVIDNWDINKEYGAIGSILKRNAHYNRAKIINYPDLKHTQLENNKVLFLYKNSSKVYQSLENLENVKHLVLPIGPNDVGILRILGNIKKFSKEDIENKDVFIFTRELKENLSEFNFSRVYLFTSKLNDYTKIFQNIYLIPFWFNVCGSFYNLFNQLIKVNNEFC